MKTNLPALEFYVQNFIANKISHPERNNKLIDAFIVSDLGGYLFYDAKMMKCDNGMGEKSFSKLYNHKNKENYFSIKLIISQLQTCYKLQSICYKYTSLNITIAFTLLYTKLRGATTRKGE